MDGTIAATYTLIYRFLKQQSQTKAAEAVKRAAKPTVVLRDDIEQDGPSLEDIVKEWKTKTTVTPDKDSSSEESESSDDTSSDSEESSDSSSQESEDTSSSESEEEDASDSGDETEKAVSKKKPVESDTSATLSSVGENGKVGQVPKQPSSKDKKESGSESDSSDSGSESSSSDAESDETHSSDDSEEETTGEQQKTKSTSESSSESEDDTDSEPQQERAAKKRKISADIAVVTTVVASESSSDSDSDSDSEPQQKRDARKMPAHEAAGTTTAATGSQPVVRKKEVQPTKIRARFQRVKIDNVTPDLLLNNDYQAKGGSTSDYGERAHRDLVVTRGAGFRKEKNKKKRGAYRGGEITLENHSIKFNF